MSTNPFDQDIPMENGNGAGIDLSEFDDDFEAAESPEYDEVPDGKYQARVEKAVLTHAQSSGEPMIKWDLVVVSGSQEGRHIFKNSVISRKSIPFVKKDLITLGVEINKISELPNHIEKVLDKVVEISLRTKGEYRNCYFNKQLNIQTSGDIDTSIPW